MKRNLLNYRHQFSAIGLIALTTFMGVSTHAQEGTIGILNVIPFDEATNVPQAVRDECQLGEKVSEFLVQYAKNVKASPMSFRCYLSRWWGRNWIPPRAPTS